MPGYTDMDGLMPCSCELSMSELLVPLPAAVVSVAAAIAGFVGFVSVASQAETETEALNVSPSPTAYAYIYREKNYTFSDKNIVPQK